MEEFLGSLEEIAGPFKAISGSVSSSLGVVKGISGSMDLVLAINDLPKAFQ